MEAGATSRQPMDLSKLPWGGYRLACSIEGSEILGDALVAIMPKIPQDPFIQWGGDAAMGTDAIAQFSARWMQRMGMKLANTLSPGGVVGRWQIVNPQPGVWKWKDAAVDAMSQRGIIVSGFLGMKHPPAWVKEKFYKDGKIADYEGFTQDRKSVV